MCNQRWELYRKMTSTYYKGSDPVRHSVYRRAVEAYSRHIFYCDECRMMLSQFDNGPENPWDETLENAIAKERGVE